MSAPFTVEAGRPDLPPIVFFHGFLGQPSMWRAVTARLSSPSPRVLATLPGHGPRPWGTEGGDFARMVDRVAESLPFGGAGVLVGYSMGARLALSLLIRHPGRARAALLVGVDPGLRDQAAREQRLAWDAEQAMAAETLGIKAFAERWARLPLFATQAALAPGILQAQREERERHEPAAIAWAMRSLGLGAMPPCWDGLSRVRAPVTFVSGGADGKFSAIAREAASRCPGARHLVAPGAGHNVAIEAPALVATAIDEMVARCATEPAGPSAARREERES